MTPFNRERTLRAHPRKAAVVAFLEASLAQGVSPSTQAIRNHMGWKNVGTARACLRALNAQGLLPSGYDRSALGLLCSPRGTRVLTAKGWEAA
jgi:hypothetical protein